jgi:exonuclease SbcD
VKLAHFADLHLDTAFKWAPVPVARARRQALRQTLTGIAAVAVEQEVDALLCAGDLYEQENWTPDTAAFLRDTFEQLSPLPVFLAPGNHDWLGPISLYRQVHWSANVHLFTEDRLRPVELTDGITLWGAAHRAPAGTGGFLERFQIDRGGVNVALFHGSERGGLFAQGDGKQPHAPFDAARIPQTGLVHAFCGHFHAPKLGDYHTYPGNPEPLAFGESGARGVVIATIADDGSISREVRAVTQTEVQDVQVDITGCASAAEVRTRVASALAGLHGMCRVILEGAVEPTLDLNLADLSSLQSALDAVVYTKGRLRSSQDLDVIGQEQTVRGQFVRDVLDSEMDHDEQRRVIETGLRALSGRKDLEVV